MPITTANINSTTTVLSQKKFLADRLLKRSLMKLVAASVCDKISQPHGTGLTANFVRFERMNVPLVPITEGVDPSQSTFGLTNKTVTLDQWGDILALTDVTQLTTFHPVMEQATKLLADNAARVMDREIQIVWLSGTNVIYGDGSVASRSAITSAMILTDTLIHKARITLADAGAPPRDGPARQEDAKAVAAEGSLNGNSHYLAITDAFVTAQIMTAGTSLGTFASVSMYANAKALYNAEVGSWLGLRWVETNFIPKFSMLGNTTAAVASGSAFGTDTPVVTALDSPAGGGLTSSSTYFYKVTRKSKLTGFEEAISIAHSTATPATGNTEAFSFNFTNLTAGYVWNLYFANAAATGTDANLFLHTANIEVGTTVTVNNVVTSGTNPPQNVNTTGTPVIHVIYIHGDESCNWVGLQDLQVLMSGMTATTDNPLLLRRTIGYKFMAKAMIRDQTRMLRLEVASTF